MFIFIRNIIVKILFLLHKYLWRVCNIMNINVMFVYSYYFKYIV